MITKTIELGQRQHGQFYAEFVLWRDGKRKVIDTFAVFTTSDIGLWLSQWMINGTLPDGRVGFREIK